MKAAIITLAVVVVLAITTVASASRQDNYGGVSPAYRAQMVQLVYSYFGSGWKGQTMVRCMMRESGANPRAANWGDSHGGSFGLFQINGIHDPAPGNYATRAWIQKMWNPVQNVEMAVRLARGGLGPWGGGC